jgi:beta-lactam-binding protein with PASTA domain
MMAWLGLIALLIVIWIIYIFFPKSSINKTLDTPILGGDESEKDEEDYEDETIQEHWARTYKSDKK